VPGDVGNRLRLRRAIEGDDLGIRRQSLHLIEQAREDGAPPVNSFLNDGRLTPRSAPWRTRHSKNAGEATELVAACVRICSTTGPGSMAPGYRRSASGMRLVTPEPRLASATIGSVARSTSPARSDRLSTSERCWASRKPWLRTAALGWPVLPLVNVNSAGLSGWHSWTSSSGSRRSARERETVHGIGKLPPMTNLVGMRRRAGMSSRRRWAFGAAISARGACRAQQLATCARPAEGSRNMETRPSRNSASRVTYSSADIG